MISPCKDCPDRTVRCHADCEKYAEWDKWNKAQREKAKDPTLAYEFERNNKIRKRRKR